MNAAYCRWPQRPSPVPLILCIVGVMGLIITGCDHTPAAPPDPPVYEFASRDLSPILGTFFFLSDPDSATIPRLVPGSLRVYLDDHYFPNDTELGAQSAEVWLDPAQATATGHPYIGIFHRMVDFDEYYVIDYEIYHQPLLVLREALGRDHTLAVTYRQVLTSGDTVEVGSSSPPGPGEELQLKMIRPNEETWREYDLTQSPWGPARRLELRNVYDLGASKIYPDGFLLRVVRDLGRKENPWYLFDDDGVKIPLIEVLGLDQRDNNNASDWKPDGLIDPEYVDFSNGRLFFPDLRPFDPSRTDIEGNIYRMRSWPVGAAYERPYALGWSREGSDWVRRSEVYLANETVPEIYDLRPDRLSIDAHEHHTYTIEVSFGN